MYDWNSGITDPIPGDAEALVYLSKPLGSTRFAIYSGGTIGGHTLEDLGVKIWCWRSIADHSYEMIRTAIIRTEQQPS